MQGKFQHKFKPNKLSNKILRKTLDPIVLGLANALKLNMANFICIPNKSDAETD